MIRWFSVLALCAAVLAVASSASALDLDGAKRKGLIGERPDVIFHLAAIVSGEAEADFEKGYRINLDGTRYLLEAIRLEGVKSPYVPRLVFTSSIAVFGAPFPDAIGDEFLSAPLTSYGTQKAIGELLLNDYSRKGFVDGIGIRLPTIVVRPGKPNAAASGFFSNILREPLVGQEAVLPVGRDVRHWFASPRAAINLILSAKALAFVRGRAYVLPGDVRDLALDVMRHRLVLSYEALADGVSADEVLRQILTVVPVPEVPLHERIRARDAVRARHA